jgi:hypothetical protein
MALSKIINDGVTGMSIDSSEVLSLDKSVIAKMSMSTATHNHTEQQWHRHTFDTVDFDSYSSIANVAKTTGVQSGSGFLIPYAGYYKIYYQVHMGVTGEDGTLRDAAALISRYRSSAETVLGSSFGRHQDAGYDIGDLTFTITVIDDCQAGDEIVFRHFMNTGTSTPYDVYSKVGEDDNGHLFYNSAAVPKASYCWIQRIT